jgi:hypothetical protein
MGHLTLFLPPSCTVHLAQDDQESQQNRASAARLAHPLETELSQRAYTPECARTVFSRFREVRDE